MGNRAVARSITVSTATGIFGPVYFGSGFRFASVAFSQGAASTAQTLIGTVQGSMGNSGVWNTVLALTTGNSTGSAVYLNSTASRVFDKLRVNLSANNRTAAFTITLGVGD